VISTKQKSVGVLLDLSTAPDKDVNVGDVVGCAQFSDCQLNLKIQFVGLL
jgi:hypothetical protein